jgi:hypothetical protein
VVELDDLLPNRCHRRCDSPLRRDAFPESG